MNVKHLFLKVALMVLPYSICLAAPASGYRSTSGSGAQDQAAINQLRVVMADLKNELHNHDAEIRIFQAKVENQELMMDQLRQQLTDDLQAQRESSRAQAINIESKVDSLDTTVKGLMTDLRQLKTQANESVTVLGQYKQKLMELEKLIDAQNHHMQNLEAALKSIIDVLQVKEGTDRSPSSRATDSAKMYKVQSGDSLDKIARQFKISVQTLKELNGLTNDRIVVGQILRIP